MWKIKDPEAVKAMIIRLLSDDEIAKRCNRQMDDRSSYILLFDDNDDIMLRLDKERFVNVPEYKPNDWNPYPEVEPIEEGKYLVYVCSDGQKFIDVDEYTIKNGEGDWRVNFNDDVLAFRPLNVEPPELEDLN